MAGRLGRGRHRRRPGRGRGGAGGTGGAGRPVAVPAPARAAGPARRGGWPPPQPWWPSSAVGVIATRDSGGGGEEFAMAGTDLAGSASADGTFDETDSGLEITLDIRGLPAAPDGFFYEAWMRTENDDAPDLTAIGTFHMRGGDSTVTLWSAVDTDTHPIITVTLQELGAGPESSGEVVLRGSLRRLSSTVRRRRSPAGRRPSARRSCRGRRRGGRPRRHRRVRPRSARWAVGRPRRGGSPTRTGTAPDRPAR